jgi:hypothetical protein
MARKPQNASNPTPEEVGPSGAESSPAPKSEPLPGLGGVSPILKPSGFSLDKFKSKRPIAAAGVKTLIGALQHYPIPEAQDYVRLHPDEKAYWSPELCFVDVPITGMKKDTVHLIDEDLIGLLPAGKKVKRHALALAAKPYNTFFLAHVPTVNLDNSWNESSLQGCRLAKIRWVQLASLKDQGQERYEIGFPGDEDAFPETDWPTDTLEALIGASFVGRTIETADHPGMLRLLGKKQSLG